MALSAWTYFQRVKKCRIFFSFVLLKVVKNCYMVFRSSFLIIRPIHVKITNQPLFLPNFTESEVKITWFRRFRNLLGKYRLLISFLRVIGPLDWDLEYHFGPKVLEYGRKMLYLARFLQLVFVTNFPFMYTALIAIKILPYFKPSSKWFFLIPYRDCD